MKWWRGNRLEKCREDRKIVKNAKVDGQNRFLLFPDPLPNAGKLTEFLGCIH